VGRQLGRSGSSVSGEDAADTTSLPARGQIRLWAGGSRWCAWSGEDAGTGGAWMGSLGLSTDFIFFI
jgi:hypothetical protein